MFSWYDFEEQQSLLKATGILENHLQMSSLQEATSTVGGAPKDSKKLRKQLKLRMPVDGAAKDQNYPQIGCYGHYSDTAVSYIDYMQCGLGVLSSNTRNLAVSVCIRMDVVQYV
jgi:hypothetical protein